MTDFRCRYAIVALACLLSFAPSAAAQVSDSQLVTTPVTRDPHLHPDGRNANQDWRNMAPPVAQGAFVRPAAQAVARPVWGHRNGLRVGLYPMPGPRGLIRIYTPYLGLEEYRMINFIAVEPILKGESTRGVSELEKSELDIAPGKRFWAADSPENAAPRLAEDHPARGVIGRDGDVQILQVLVMMEPFANGAHPYIGLTFRSDRPNEVGISTFAYKNSKPMTNCIVTATMGNFARLRLLHLAERVVSSREIWPDYKGDRFARQKPFHLKELFRTSNGQVVVAATPDEADPSQLKEGFPHPGWRYPGKKATQYWRSEAPSRELKAQVNGRFTYYNTRAAIPGGISFENFELIEPFQNGKQFWFGATLQTPEELMGRK